MAKKQRPAGGLLAALAEQFPQAFSLNPQRRRPLKVGIKIDLKVRAIAMTDRDINAALHLYCNHPGSWHASTSEGAARVDLDGLPAGAVTAEEARHAREKLGAQSPKSPPPAPEPKPVKLDGLAELRASAQQRKTGSEQNPQLAITVKWCNRCGMKRADLTPLDELRKFAPRFNRLLPESDAV